MTIITISKFELVQVQ